MQNCCQSPVTFCEIGYGKQDTWTWTVTGGSILSGQGSDCISVLPANTGNLQVSVIASRSSGHPSYTRNDSKTVTRTDPVTSPITGPEFVCTDQSFTLCFEPICGMTQAAWMYSPIFNLVSEPNSNCITLIPNNMAQNGQSTTISGQAVMPSGCSANWSSHELTIYSSETPPQPAGYVQFYLPNGWDPCGFNEIRLPIIFNPSNPYNNGTTTISPPFYTYLPHHINHDGGSINVTVCYKNLCSGISTCNTFRLPLPPPCDDPFPLIGDDDPLIIAADKTESGILDKFSLFPFQPEIKEVEIFPNPASDFISITTPFLKKGQVTLLDLNGNTLITQSIYDLSRFQLDLFTVRQSGLFGLMINSTDGDMILKWIIIDK